MWFVFPQVEGLGSSLTSMRYAIRSLDEAQMYLAHSILGARLRELTSIVVGHSDIEAEKVFGSIDAMKFHSSMTLFSEVSGHEDIFQSALDAFFAGKLDELTLDWMQRLG